VAREEGAPSAEAERQNGAERKPREEEAPAREVAQPSQREAERVFETVTTVSEQPSPPSEARGETHGEPEAPRRRGWWQR
jgi:hypothetical protein